VLSLARAVERGETTALVDAEPAGAESAEEDASGDTLKVAEADPVKDAAAVALAAANTQRPPAPLHFQPPRHAAGADNDCDGTVDERPECGGPRTDVAENASATWAAGESVDDNPSPCGQRPSAVAPGPTTFYVDTDTSSVVAGASAARTDYLYPGAAYVVGSYPAGRTGAWDLRTTSGLTFQYRVSLPANITVQPSPVSPYIILCSAGGGYAAYAPTASLTNANWVQFTVPLAGGNGWVTGATANFDPSNVHSVEFQLDPTRGGNPGTVQMYLDDVRFY
jgi:hypothetical protein